MKVLHVNDVARAGTVITTTAQGEGLDWRLRDTATVTPSALSLLTKTRRAFKGAVWSAGLASQAWNSDLLHVHFATVTNHTRWLRRPYFLHLHGSDVRDLRYDPRYKTLVERAIAEAETVYYVTPDLAEHVLDLRPDARFFPVVVDTEDVPKTEVINEPKILFASRWDSSKGAATQLEVARAVVARAGRVPVEGLAWGSHWQDAQALGIRMRPRMDHDDYLTWLASGSVIIGQSTGVMGASELEALATGVPLVMPLLEGWYNGSHPSIRDTPVFGGTVGHLRESPEAVSRALGQLIETPRLTGARDWVTANHGPLQAVRHLQNDYLNWKQQKWG